MQASIITGHKGFIAGHLYEYLKDKEGPLACYDIKGDLTQDIRELESLPESKYVFDLAADTSVPECEACPKHCLDTNVEGTANVLYQANRAGYESIIFASSAAVYGDKQGPCDESMDLEPLGVYGVSKMMGESLVSNFGKACSLRLFNVYGPGCKGVIDTYVEAALKGEPLYIEGDGMQVRDFVHVDDVVRAMHLAASKGVEGEYNIGTGRECSIGNLARWIIKETKSPSIIKFRDKRKGDIRESLCDYSKAKRVLNWEPQIQLEEGVMNYVKWKMSSSSGQGK